MLEKAQAEPLAADSKGLDPDDSSLTSQVLTGASIVAMIGILFLPMFYLHDINTPHVSRSVTPSLEVTVGLGAIVRTMMRRFFSVGARSLVSTAAGTMGRAVARVITRRFLRSSVRAGILSQTTKIVDQSEASTSTQTTKNALTAGFLALFVSFWIILLLAPTEGSALHPDEPIMAIGAALIAALPLLIYAFMTYAVAKRLGVKIQYSTRLDGLLLQAYFTGAGSFLPITTDIDYEGPSRSRALVAGISLASLLIISLALKGIHVATGMWQFEFPAAMFLLYAFVYSFPMAPLDGRDIWEHSKLAWAGTFLVILVAFQLTVPEQLTFFL